MTMSSLGFASGSVIQEFGYDDDVDEAVRAQIEEETGQELVDEDYRDIVDGPRPAAAARARGGAAKPATSTTSPTSFSI